MFLSTLAGEFLRCVRRVRRLGVRIAILAFLKPNCRNLAFFKVVGLGIFGLAFK